MSFPVALFHYFNQPEYFEKFVIEKKREMYPKEDELQKEELEQLFQMVRAKHDAKYKENLENLTNKQQRA